MAQSDEMMFVVPGDDPPQIQGSPHLEKLNPHGRIVVHTDRPASTEEKIARVKEHSDRPEYQRGDQLDR